MVAPPATVRPDSGDRGVVRIDTVFAEAPTCARLGRVTIRVRDPRAELRYQLDGVGELQASNVVEGVAPGTYTAVAYLPGRCSDRVTVVVPPLRDSIRLAPPTIGPSSCTSRADGSVTPALVGDADARTYEYRLGRGGTWEFGHTYGGLRTGTYWLRARTPGGCRDSLAVSVPVDERMRPGLVVEGPTEAGYGEPVTLRVRDTTRLPPPSRFDWFVGGQAPDCLDAACEEVAITVAAADTVTVTARDTAGCAYGTRHALSLAPRGGLFLPTAFSPDGDGVNDVWRPRVTEAVERVARVLVVDRWGGVAYACSPCSPREGWDGTTRGREAGPGTYVAAVTVRYAGGAERTEVGTVALLR